MKKIFVLILVFGMLIPLGAVGVSGTESGFTESPFYGLGWSDMDNSVYPYLEGLVQSNFSVAGDRAKISYNGASVTHVKDGPLDDAAVTKFAEKMKATMDSRPEGLRYWHLWAPAKILRMKPENVIFLDYGVDQMRDLVEAILAKYKEIGGKLDGLVVDTEYTGMTAGSVNALVQTDPDIYQKIVDDPRYATEVRPLLAERNFPFMESASGDVPEILSIASNSTAQSIWNTVMRNRLNLYVNEWGFDPLMAYFPDATLSDYQSMDSYAWLKGIAITDDGQNYSDGGNSVKSGNVSCFSFYFARPAKNFYDNLDNYVSFNDALYEASPFNTLLFDINLVRRMYESTDTHMIAPWITAYVYNSKKNGTLAYTPYYAEQILHLGLLDPEPFLVYMYIGEYSNEDWNNSCQTLNELLAELTRVAGFSDRKAIPLPQYWNSEFVLSGMYAGGRNIWRISPNTDEISLEDFKIEGADPTFQVDGQTITFPGGKIIETATISNVGSCGYWVETAADVTPIVENDPNRFTRNPSLCIDFENSPIGPVDSTTMPQTTWTAIDFSGTNNANVISTAGGNMLSLTGSVFVSNTKIPGNITAGDHYAKDQDWYITVTIPENLSPEADIRLLSYSGHGQAIIDGGFRIAGGKLYYAALNAENAATQEDFHLLAELPAGTYCLRRAMNFNDPQKFLCHYMVFDATGKILGEVRDVAIPTFEYIKSINFSCTNVDKAVLLDNFIITVTGAVADFELYDAKTGIIVTDLAAARDADTAYRLSWLNATTETRTATIVAAIYEGNTLKEERIIKKVEMRPGYDGVETGIVKIEEGQTVTVYLKAQETSDQPPAVEVPVKKTNNLPLILLIGAVVISTAGIVVALAVTKPTKKS